MMFCGLFGITNQIVLIFLYCLLCAYSGLEQRLGETDTWRRAMHSPATCVGGGATTRPNMRFISPPSTVITKLAVWLVGEREML